ncbi:hypothetical protein E2C01_093180 [Portunus trituberculatus]|uniref:Uncharacterized protein n=1 Tax=Portunus trituberculatus TaxID=210409 RepID=A0A5B7JTT9_PORTR|nr:hypothetical protein [Portunus trituberculatus]
MEKAREEGKIAFFKHTRLIIKDKSTNYQYQGRSSRSGGVSTDEAVCDVTGAIDQASEASDDESSVGADGRNADSSTCGAVGFVSGAVVQKSEVAQDARDSSSASDIVARTKSHEGLRSRVERKVMSLMWYQESLSLLERRAMGRSRCVVLCVRSVFGCCFYS